eukprot:gene46857-37560_t
MHNDSVQGHAKQKGGSSDKVESGMPRKLRSEGRSQRRAQDD